MKLHHILGAFTVAAGSLIALPASADVIDSCGKVDISGTAKCEVVAKVDCDARCSPVSLLSTATMGRGNQQTASTLRIKTALWSASRKTHQASPPCSSSW